jgi:dihydrofolate reductase
LKRSLQRAEARRKEVVAVVGVATNGVIGRNGSIPWHSSVDMRHFRRVTTGHPVVMGRKTFESIGKILPNRLNVIMTRDPQYAVDGALVVHSREEVLETLAGDETIMIIGGDQIYREFYSDLTRIELTQIELQADGDAFFQLDPMRDWKIAASHHEIDEKLGARLEFRTYVPDDTDDPYLSKDVKGLLRLFGSGEPIPGSGAAAALQGLLAGYLVLTVIQISRSKESQRDNLRAFAQYAYAVSSYIVPRLRELFLDDIRVFGDVVPLRRRRDASSGAARAAITRQLNRRTAEATAIPEEIGRLATELFTIAEFLYERGYPPVRGDSGAAMSAALSAMLSASFVMNLNVRTLARSGGEDWVDPATERQRELLAAIARIPTHLALDRPADPAQLTLALPT